MKTSLKQELDRLKHYNSLNNPSQSLVPFFHAANSLLKYSQDGKENKIDSTLFIDFYSEFEQFSKSDFSLLKKNQEQILFQIVQIIESENFLKFIRPDIFKKKRLRNSLRKEKIEEIELEIEHYDLTTGEVKKLSESFENSTSSNFTDNGQPVTANFNFQHLSEASSGNSSSSKSIGNNNLLDSIRLSYSEHNLDEANQLAQQFLSKADDLNKLSQEDMKLLKDVSEEYELMSSFYKEFETCEWIPDKQQDGINMQYLIYPDGSFALKVDTEGEIPVEPFLSILSEVDLMDEYVPFCYGAKELKKISRNERIGTSKVYMPLLCDRQTFFYAAGYDRMKTHNSLFFFSKTINDDYTAQKKYDYQIPKQTDFVRLVYDFFIVEYTPVGKNRAKIRLASKVDMKMNFIPNFLLFQTARVFAFDYFKNIMDRIKNYKGSEWEKRVENNPDMYKFFDKKINQYFPV